MKNYQFEVLDKEINKHKEESLLREKAEKQITKKKEKKYRLRRWVYITLWTGFVAFITLSIYQIYTIKTIHTTPVGTYTCHGKLIQVCNGSKEVADYLGV